MIEAIKRPTLANAYLNLISVPGNLAASIVTTARGVNIMEKNIVAPTK